MELVIKNIEKKYNGKVVLNNINIELKTGIYAFLGPNGAGKSTMFRMISTVEKPEKGEIYYQGSDIFQMGENYREKIGYVSQEICLFSCTIAENIALHAPNTSMEEIVEIAKKTGCHQFISLLPNRYHTVINERGVFFIRWRKTAPCTSTCLAGKSKHTDSR